ncbi:hypothetical protein DL95DRAFT_156409 [Leptodontidium sp. 2 PMI_412]|nr:hypothetical protein DL95DRAFT_156409 [Leptodontidium sp. 2 PMI_412]
MLKLIPRYCRFMHLLFFLICLLLLYLPILFSQSYASTYIQRPSLHSSLHRLLQSMPCFLSLPFLAMPCLASRRHNNANSSHPAAHM